MKANLARKTFITTVLAGCCLVMLASTSHTAMTSADQEMITQSMPPCDSGEPCIEFTLVPPYRSFENLKGRVRNVRDPSEYKVCPYIRVEGLWFTKPFLNQPCVAVDETGAWEADITTGGVDEKALEIAAFLLPQNIVPPLSGRSPRDDCTLPEELDGFPKALADRTESRRSIVFSGYEWKVKDLRWDPGPNNFSDSPENVWVDQQGQLHLRITRRDGKWFTAEVVSKDAFAYGSTIFSLGSRVDNLNENVVLGLFTWDTDACESHYNEIDVEFSKFGRVDDPNNAQYVVQPFPRCNLRRFLMPAVDHSTQVLEWQPERIRFLSLRGPELIQSYELTDTSCIPKPTNVNARMNLWLYQGLPPSDGQDVEVVIKQFLFIPWSPLK